LEVEASHEPIGDVGKKATYEEAGNLHVILLLSLGAQVMLIENIWIENGLVKGALGTIHDIIWSASLDCRRDPPFVVLVAFDGYSGPALNGDGVPKIVPIFQSTREFAYKSSNHRRIQFSLTVAYAITIYKSQGITVEKAILNLVEKDFAPGLSYVGVSWVKSLNGLMLEESFDLSRFMAKMGKTEEMRLADANRRRPQHLAP
jgi:ATP-dependent exoDNAse (exonuclease V) alpha subunit